MTISDEHAAVLLAHNCFRLTLARVRRDPRLDADAVRLFLALLERLNLDTFAAEKLDSLAADSGLGVSSVHRALRRLVAAGYLERGPRAWKGGPATYRLRFPDAGPVER